VPPVVRLILCDAWRADVSAERRVVLGCRLSVAVCRCHVGHVVAARMLSACALCVPIACSGTCLATSAKRPPRELILSVQARKSRASLPPRCLRRTVVRADDLCFLAASPLGLPWTSIVPRGVRKCPELLWPSTDFVAHYEITCPRRVLSNTENVASQIGNFFQNSREVFPKLDATLSHISDVIQFHLGLPGLPLRTIPGSKLEPGPARPAFEPAEAERRADQALAARSLLVLAGDSRGMSAAGKHCSAVSSSRSALAPRAVS
jgi:hypothetical protein